MAAVWPSEGPWSCPEVGGERNLVEEWRLLREKARLVFRSGNVRGCVEGEDGVRFERDVPEERGGFKAQHSGLVDR